MYQTGVLIGSGGMGEVYRAWDAELDRPVALKYLRVSDPAQVERLKREARAQARVDHPGVCRVYEVGDDDGRPYIAMQYVAGRQLDEAARDMSVEQKVLVVREVAEAVQAAHAAGLIHRDLKPANILVAEDDEGRPRPFVVDFGIAREQDVGGVTATGQVIGTPGYLSPEQARGEVGGLDRRTDVFSLGVILYELLVGRRPFVGDSPVEVLLALLEREPPPLRRLSPRLPRDLETVVMTCLEKDPARRYPSARALADDLGRFLAGVPVTARRGGRWRHLVALFRKHPGTAALGASSLAAVLVLAGLAVAARFDASRQALVAQRFGQETERMEGHLERSYLLPLHDIRDDVARVRERTATIVGELAGMPASLQALGEAALGRGELALGEPAAARDHLERAWQLGERSPRTARALGLALAELYRLALEEANAIRTPELRERALARAAAELREPARLALERSAGDPEHPGFLAATLAFVSQDLDGALAHLERLRQSEPFFYRGDLLAGTIHRQRFEEAARSGREAEAEAEFRRAAAAFAAAAEIGESDPRPHQQLCSLWVARLRDQYWKSGGDLTPAHDAALAACDRALTVDPAAAAAHIEAGRAQRFWAAAEAQQGREHRDALEAARRHAWQAIDADATAPAAFVLLGVVHRAEAGLLAERGEDPSEELLASVAAYREAIRLAPADHGAHMSLANSQLMLGDDARGRGRDPEPFFAAAVAAAAQAVELVPELAGGHVNLGIAYAQLAITARERGADSGELFARGAAALTRAIELNPSFLTAHFNLGELLLEQAVAELRRGLDPAPSLSRARELLEATAAGYPDWAPPYYLTAEALALEAEWLRTAGRDPTPLLARAEAAIAAGRAIHDSDAVGLSRATLAHLVAARWALDRDRDPRAAVAAGLERLEEALTVHPRLAPALVRRAELLTARAQWRLRSGRPPAEDLQLAVAEARTAADLNPNDAAAPVAEARARRLEAEWQLGQGAPPESALTQGRAAVSRALAVDPSRAAAWTEAAALWRAEAAGATDEEQRRDALARAEHAAAEARRLDPHAAGA